MCRHKNAKQDDKQYKTTSLIGKEYRSKSCICTDQVR